MKSCQNSLNVPSIMFDFFKQKLKIDRVVNLEIYLAASDVIYREETTMSHIFLFAQLYFIFILIIL